MEIKIGCCGFPLGRRKYYSLFKVVEIQKTFYQIPEEATLHRWRNEAPSDFEFIIKAWQLITHLPSSPTYRRLQIKIKNKENYGFFKNTDEVFKAWERVENCAKILKSNKILFQTPASFKQTEENIKNLKGFFKKIKNPEFTFIWEPRGNWDKKIISQLCKELNLIHCVDPFKNAPLYGNILYLRLHGKGGYKYRYTHEDFKYLINFLKEYKKEYYYIMFNNVYMLESAKEFMNYTQGLI